MTHLAAGAIRGTAPWRERHRPPPRGRRDSGHCPVARATQAPTSRPARHRPYLAAGAIQNLSRGKLTTTARSVFTTDATVAASPLDRPSELTQKSCT